MDALQKVIVVDNGNRAPESALSAELAGMGFASVTTSLEATEDVLALIASPAAVVVQIPDAATIEERRKFLDLAERLRVTMQRINVPVILMNDGHGTGAHASLLQSELGTEQSCRRPPSEHEHLRDRRH